MAGELQQRLGLVHRDPLEDHRLEQARHLRLLEAGRGIVVVAPLHVGPVPAVLRVDREPVELADRVVALRRGEQLDRLGDVELVGREVLGHAGGVVAALHVRPVLAGLDDDQRRLGDVAERERVDLGGVDLVEVLLDEALEAEQGVVADPGLGGDRLGVTVAGVAEVEALEPLVLRPVAAGDRVEVLVDRGREVVVDQVVEVLLEQPDDGERGPRGDERLPLLPDVAAVLDGLDDRRPGGRAADAELLEPLDQRCLRVPSRRGGGVPVRVDRLRSAPRRPGERRQERLAARPRRRRSPPWTRRTRRGSRGT